MSGLRLYRELLKGLKSYPSKSRDALLQDVKAEFRKNRNETDPKKIREQLEHARRGIEEIKKYEGVYSAKGRHWSVDV